MPEPCQDFEWLLQPVLAKLSLQLATAQISSLSRHYDLLPRWNRHLKSWQGSGLQLLKRPEVRIDDMLDLIRRHTQVNLKRPEWKSIETEIKYEGYLKQQKRHIQQLRRAEARRIPDGFGFAGIPGLSTEVVEKMERVSPATLGQASRIPGVTPAAISILNVYLDMPQRPRLNA